MEYVISFMLLASLTVALFDWQPPRTSYRKVGGLHHWRIGRLGGSVYLSQWSR